MTGFKPKPGTRSAYRNLKSPFANIDAFDAFVQSLIIKNPLGCTSYRSVRKNYLPVQKVRQMYTAKFVYLNPDKKQIGSGLDRYDSAEGYQNGIAAVISNMANIAAHQGKARHTPDADLYSFLLKCHDPNGEIYFLSIARNRVTLSSYTDDAILTRVEEWADRVPELR
ncbi:hypothetical protein [Methanoregula sp.]|uniref:hypothetical protein n=1 Tax=Methanoregula sp. TaxID=2052170 RepID=UPI00356882C0